jgi:hypothetical protein
MFYTPLANGDSPSHSQSVQPEPQKLILRRIERQQERFVLHVGVRQAACCPRCRIVSRSRHSAYTRTVCDLPWQGLGADIQIKTHKYRCRNPACGQKIFAERLGGGLCCKPKNVSGSGKSHDRRSAGEVDLFSITPRQNRQLRTTVRRRFHTACRADRPWDRDGVLLRSCVIETQVRRLKPTVHRRGRHDCSDSRANVDTICCLLPHRLQRSKVEGASEQSINSGRGVSGSRTDSS